MADRILDPLVDGPTATYVAFVSTALFAILTALVVSRQTAVFDHDLIVSLRTTASPALTAILLAVTFTSGKLAVPALVLFAYAIYRRLGVRAATYYAIACGVAQLLNALIKHTVGRVRPHGVSPRLTAAGGMAYPSADVMLAVVIFALGALLLSWTIRARNVRSAMIGAGALFVVADAVARVYLGAHWPTDVAAGALAGTACSAVCIEMLRRQPALPVPVTILPQNI
jgi:membrane-associated phospholipid phosphatase